MRVSFYVDQEVVEYYSNWLESYVVLRNETGTVVLFKASSFSVMSSMRLDCVFTGRWREHDITVQRIKPWYSNFTYGIPYKVRVMVWVDQNQVLDTFLTKLI